MTDLISVIAVSIPIVAIAAVTFLINQKMKYAKGDSGLSTSEKKELEELRARVHHLEVIASESTPIERLGEGS